MEKSSRKKKTVSVRVFEDSDVEIGRAATLLGWTKAQVIGHVIERSVRALSQLCDRNDHSGLLYVLRDGELTIRNAGVPE